MEPKEFWLQKIKEFKKIKNFEECIKYANKIKALDDAKNKPNFWYSKGLAYSEIQEFENALLCFDKDLELNSASFDTLYQKGIVFYFLKKNIDAIEWFNKAWEIKYSNYLKTKEQIHMLKEHKEFEKSVTHAKKLRQINSPPFQFWYYQALILTDLGKYQEATKSYDQALSIDHDNPNVLFDKAKCEFLQGMEENCLNLLKKIYKLDKSFKKKIQTESIFSNFVQINKIFT